MHHPDTSAIVLFAHGARDPLWAEPFHTLRNLLLARPDRGRVELAFLELMSPNLETVVSHLIADGFREIHLIPMFMAQGGHLRHDLPIKLQAIQDSHPDIVIHVAPAIGEVNEILAAIVSWIVKITAKTQADTV